MVYLLRHGIAADYADGGDAARALTDEGIDKLVRASAGWRRVVGAIDTVLVSPLLRAQQTAKIFMDAVAPSAPLVETSALVPEAQPTRAVELLQAAKLQNTTGIACVAHEPLLGSLLSLLLCGSSRSAIPFKRGMLAIVEIESSASMTGRLVAALSQRVAAGL